MLTARFDRALQRAMDWHRDQKRKGSGIPYVAHLLSVAGIALSQGATEDQAIAALLHDALEDQPACTQELIAEEFGPEVAALVAECSDTQESPKPPWQDRKEAYLRHLPQASPSALLISAADKLDNARSLLLDYRVVGEELWGRFQGGKDGTLWYYQEIVQAYRRAGTVPQPLLEELERVVAELAALAR